MSRITQISNDKPPVEDEDARIIRENLAKNKKAMTECQGKLESLFDSKIFNVKPKKFSDVVKGK